MADAPGGGQYYLGREDLAGFAKGWNMLLAAMVSFFIVLVAIGAYVGPEGRDPNRPPASPHEVSEAARGGDERGPRAGGQGDAGASGLREPGPLRLGQRDRR